jgi:hypothetical protein
MSGLPCAKAILDQGAALTQKLSCMGNTIMLNSATTQPTEQMEDEFRDAANALAAVATKIERYCRTGGQ